MAVQEVKLDNTDIVALDQCDAARNVATLTLQVSSMTAQLARAQANLAASRVQLRAVQATVCVGHGVTPAPSASITRATRPDGQYLVVSA